MIKSNITIRSNIYVRKTKNIKEDIDFIKNITGYKALKKIEPYINGTLNSVKLSEVQKRELENGSKCSYCKIDEINYGKVILNGNLVWQGRCEYSECERFSICESASNFNRRNEDIVDSENYQFEISSDSFEYLRIKAEDLENKSIIQECDEIFENDIEYESKEFDYIDNKVNLSSDFIKIDETNIIINSDIESRILVNAGPGTGKTYTVIQRLLYIIKNNLVDLGNIIVLCYTKSAVRVIKERVLEGVRRCKKW